jgi:hypothetical protein
MQKMVCKLSSSLCEKFIPSQPEIRISRMHVEAAKCNLANSKMMLESIELARGESRCYPICRTDMKPYGLPFALSPWQWRIHFALICILVS